ncbi:uncharacterized protein LOC114518077 [Dendronephthya gigantea]|uniref:uncharacterized protein LOC114518077 n=1 Tax=Dendronephthya gigantea TaxID=151771 RepID=UPI00106AA18E|nr:uncharacterized protein LOC114518077 [Dendronephthya gigantea]
MNTLWIYVLCISRISAEDIHLDLPLGHGRELGKHKLSDGHVEQLYEIPNPGQFWEKYASKGTPVVFKDAAKNFPAFELWTDEFLIRHYGNLEVKLESKKEKNKIPIGEKGLGRDTIRSYLNDYKSKDSYVVSQLPDPMARDVNLLSCLSCGTFSKRIMEANLWLSSGGTSSLLHRDADNAINCLLNGTKDWILIHPKHEDKIPIAQGDKGYGGFATLDVDNVNLIKYSDFKHVPWQYANLTAGDCLFLPYGYWHQVRSYGTKNMAVSVLFSRLKEFSATGCNRTEYTSIPLSNANMIWTYPGHGPQTLGNSDPFDLRDGLAEMVLDLENKNKKFDSADFLFEWFTKADLLEEEDERRSVATLIYEELKISTNGAMSSDSIRNLSIEMLKSLAMLIEGDPANSEEYEHAVFTPDEIGQMIKKTLAQNSGKFSHEMLSKSYQNLGGSEHIARELFFDMDKDENGVVTEEEVSQTLKDVLNKFEKKYNHDPSNDYYRGELEKDKEMMEKIHNEL